MATVTSDEHFWRDVLEPMEDLLINWQTRPCECKPSGLYRGIFCNAFLCKRCEVVQLCSKFKYAVRD